MQELTPNEAMRVYAQCGLSLAHFGIQTGQRKPASTKAGPGRRHEDGDGTRTTEQKRAGAYGRGLSNWRNGRPNKGRI